jgi:hypothetical protein
MPFCPECGAEKFGDTCNKCSVSPTATIANKPESQERISQQGQITISSSPSDPDSLPRPFLNAFQKNVIFVAATLLVLATIAFFGNNYVQERARHLAEQKIQWRKANIKVLKDMSRIGALSTEEQTRVDNAGDDYDRLQQVLLDIHQERLNYWSHRIDDLLTKYREYKSSPYSQAVYGEDTVTPKYQKVIGEAKENYDGFTAAKVKIRAWKPVSFEDFQAGKMIDSGAAQHDKPTEQ